MAIKDLFIKFTSMQDLDNFDTFRELIQINTTLFVRVHVKQH